MRRGKFASLAEEDSPVKINVEKVFMIYEGLSWFDGANIHLVSVFSDNTVHQTHLRPYNPTLKFKGVEKTSKENADFLYQVVQVAKYVDTK